MEIIDYKKVGITRTQSLIINSIIKLLQTYSFDEITISEICEKANVARATFYRNFDSKDAVICLYIDTLVYDYFNKLTEYAYVDFELTAKNYFEYWYHEQEILIILEKNNLTNILLNKYSIVEDYLCEIGLSNIDGLSDNDIYYFYSFHFAGLWRLVFLWAQHNFKESPQDMTDTYLRIQKLSRI
ncbi:MAG: TetR/AcrR family transcriptional regulator [Spirochaetaceae bacterium]